MRVTFILVMFLYCVSSKKSRANAKANVQANVKANTQANVKANTQANVKANTQANVKANTQVSNPEIEQLRKLVASLSKQVMMQQLHVEEKSRSEGNSGIKLVRGVGKGQKNYDSNSHLYPSAFAIHDHSNYDRTIGIGEICAVLNGVDFRTRHNDYKLVMPSQTSSIYHATEDIPFPDVPPEVLNKKTVEEQVAEMKEWFKAFNDQDRSSRDYTKYFKPVLCYLEGTWTLDKELEEPFPSDRHYLEAKSWDELHEKNRFTTYTGTKARLENVAYLPTTIMSVNMTTGEAQYAQWNYRILCHPIGYDIPLHFFQQEDDLSFRVRTSQTLTQTAKTRAARYKLFDPSRKTSYQILDSIFAEIPGKDNYGSNLTFTTFAEDMFDTGFSDNTHLLNTGYYHRAYKSFRSGAGGIAYTALGFNDDNLWVSQTTQPRVASIETDNCFKVLNKFGKLATRCNRGEIRVSYAIPLEVIFLTPLLTWNPYNIVFHDDPDTAIKDDRTGSKEKPLNGIDKSHYYMTPMEFFTGPRDMSDPADTVKTYIYVLAPDGEAKKVSSSGTRISIPEIGRSDPIRVRYPIAPVHYEGSSVWKELTALKDREDNSGVPSSVVFEMSITVQDPPGEHSHEFKLNYEEFSLLIAEEEVQVVTSEAQEHAHELTIVFDPKTKSFKYTSCDNDRICFDGHPTLVTLITQNDFTRSAIL
ncbi:unnamed protein product [Candidula unifasciata]|uniref:Uncharacterized protein n=1 Tax=Candidula unifasciata TaxID=100452 RepID=A0A8S4A4N6_9EUPU|nr:unnamed protein product [Candidula unifasciata]